MTTQGLFSERGRQIVLGLGLLSLLATALSVLFGQELKEPEGVLMDSYSDSAVGHRAWVETLQSLGFFVTRHRGADITAARAPMLFLESFPEHPAPSGASGAASPHLEEALIRRFEAGLISIVVLPKWNTQDGESGTLDEIAARHLLELAWKAGEPDGVQGSARSEPELHHRTPQDVAWEEEFEGLGRSFSVVTSALATLSLRGDGATLIGTRSRALVVERTLGSARLLVVSDADLVHSFNIHRGNHAALWVSLLRDALHTDTVVVDETFHGHLAPNSLSSALGRLPLLPATLHFLLLVILVVVAGARRFGPPVPLPPVYGRGPKEIIRVTAQVFALGRPVAHLVHTYVERVLAELASHAGRKSGGAASTLDDRAIDELAARRRIPPRAVHLRTQVAALLAHPKQAQREGLALARSALAFRQRFAVRSRKELE